MTTDKNKVKIYEWLINEVLALLFPCVFIIFLWRSLKLNIKATAIAETFVFRIQDI